MWRAIARLPAPPPMTMPTLSEVDMQSLANLDVLKPSWGMSQLAYDAFVLGPVSKHVKNAAEWKKLFRGASHKATIISLPLVADCRFTLASDECQPWRRRKPRQGRAQARATPAVLSAATKRVWLSGKPVWRCADSERLLREFADLAKKKFTGGRGSSTEAPSVAWLTHAEWVTIARNLWKVGCTPPPGRRA